MGDQNAEVERGWAALRAGAPNEGAAAAEGVLSVHPDHVGALALLTMARLSEERADLAVEPARRAAALEPENIEHRRKLAAALTLAGRRANALEIASDLLTRGVRDVGTRLIHAESLKFLLRFDEAIESFRAGLAEHAGNTALASGLAHTTNYAPSCTPEQTLAEHRRFGEILSGSPARPPAWRVTADPDRPLRVGFISADLRAHSVAYFLEPILEHLDRSRVTTVCFSTHPTEDWMTARLKRHAGAWHSMAGRSPATVASRVLTERIDVLIDLGGLTTNEIALRAMVSRPAPVQVTYLGYPNTCGVPAIGYRLVDSTTDPAGAEAFAVEELVRLDPCFLCYRAPEDAPPVADPSNGSRAVTFGSFNNALKLNDEVIGVWARVVASVPGATLLLKGAGVSMKDPGFRERVALALERAGLARERVEIIPDLPRMDEHLGLYGRVDVALDPFPYNGTTTTMEALWMGVPVVSLRGRAHAGRVGGSLLHTVGLNELVADSPDEYVAIAGALARDRSRLAEYRRALRERVAASPLCDAPGFARRFEGALRGLWVRWCRERAALAGGNSHR